MKTLIITIVVFLIIQLIYIRFWPTDSTDLSRWRRSGLSVYTDAATGVQYVKAGWFGSVTPRVHADGRVFSIK